MEDWLHELGLEEYWVCFKDAGYTESRMLEDLKSMSKEALEQELQVHKIAHLNKLYSAIKKLRYPTPGKLSFSLSDVYMSYLVGFILMKF